MERWWRLVMTSAIRSGRCSCGQACHVAGAYEGSRRSSVSASSGNRTTESSPVQTPGPGVGAPRAPARTDAESLHPLGATRIMAATGLAVSPATSGSS